MKRYEPMSPERVARQEQNLLARFDIRRYRRYVRLLGGKQAARHVQARQR